MKNNYISSVINRYFGARHNRDTELKVQKWLLDEKYTEEKQIALSKIWDNIDEKPNAELYRSLAQVQQRLGMKRGRRVLWRNPLLRVAAILIPALTLVGTYLLQSRDVTMVEIATLIGEQREVILPDGSTVWLNACSEIIYSEEFDGDLREVELSGEALFAVVKDVDRRFIVATKDMDVEVLGTEFNVRSYPKDNIASTTLISGKVEVTIENQEYLLSPNQKLVYNRAEGTSTLRDTPQSSLAWRDGVLIFDQMTISEITKNLERHYKIKFQYNAGDFSEDIYSVKFSNSDDIETIMEVIHSLVGDFSYSIKSNIITLKRE